MVPSEWVSVCVCFCVCFNKRKKCDCMNATNKNRLCRLIDLVARLDCTHCVSLSPSLSLFVFFFPVLNRKNNTVANVHTRKKNFRDNMHIWILWSNSRSIYVRLLTAHICVSRLDKWLQKASFWNELRSSSSVFIEFALDFEQRIYLIFLF